MTPAFDLQGGLPLVLARGLAVAALLSAFGTLAFANLVLPRALAGAGPDLVARIGRQLAVLVRASVAVALLAAPAWLVVSTAGMADADTPAAALAALPAVLRSTAFGHVMAAQVLALVLLGVTVGGRGALRRPRLAFALAALALGLQAGHSHAAAMESGPGLLLALDVAHLAGAGGWLGGLLPLRIVVRQAPAPLGARAARWFAPLGQACILLLGVSALVQGCVLVGSVAGLAGTAYGWMVLAKLALSAVLLGFAARNRYRLAPALLHAADAGAARRRLLRSLTLQTGAALALVAAATVLSDLPPAMHLQPVWPFDRQPDLSAVREDAGLRREALLAAAGLAAAVAIAALSVLGRSRRVGQAARGAGLVAAVAIAWFAVPHLGVLLADATPTSFYRSPTGFSSDSIVAGASLFAANCAVCHGTGGAGDGPLARHLPVPPANLTEPHLLAHADGELFWWLSHGIRTPQGAQAMPGFASRLSEDQLWAVIDFVRARALGTAYRATAGWPVPARAPGFQARCGTALVQAPGPPGDAVRLVIGPAPAGPTVPGLRQIGTQPGPSPACVATDETLAAAYGIVAGAVPGTQILIDAAGWLRAVQTPGAAMGWNDPAALHAALRDMRSRPVGDGVVMMDMKM